MESAPPGAAIVDGCCPEPRTPGTLNSTAIRKQCRKVTSGRIMRKSGRVAWRECMGIEPTQPAVRRVACGFEDRDGHQAASTPLLHDLEPVGPSATHFSNASRPGHGGKIGSDTIRRDGDEQTTGGL